MRATIYQPQYFPRLHYFNRIFSSDIFVALSSAQYTKSLTHTLEGKRHKSFQSDTPVKHPDGTYFLTIPTHHNGQLPINKTSLVYSEKWNKKHINIIKSLYTNSPYGKYLLPSIELLLSKEYNNLSELNMTTIIWGISCLLELDLSIEELTLDIINEILPTLKSFNLKRIIDDRDVGIERPKGLQKGTEWTVLLCKELGVSEYLHGETAEQSYMDKTLYKKFTVQPVLQKWECQKYKQLFMKKTGFIENLSIIDLLCNNEPKTARDILGIPSRSILHTISEF